MKLSLFDYDNPEAAVVNDDRRILGDLSEKEWNDLARLCERRIFPAGRQVLAAGEKDRTLFILVSGTVDVFVNKPEGPQWLSTVLEGSVFGEVSFFDGGPRSASIVARTDVEVLALRHDLFEQLAAWHPRVAHILLMDLGRVLSARLRRLTKAV